MEFLADWQTKYFDAYVIPWSINIITALVIFIIGRWVAKLVTRWIERLLLKAKVDTTLTSFLGNVIYAALFIVVIIAALDRLGVDTTSVLAVFAAAGLAIGLALTGVVATLSWARLIQARAEQQDGKGQASGEES